MKPAVTQPAVFITGASTGIGRAIATELIAKGYRVWGTSRNKSRLADIPQLHPLELDFARPESVEAAWKQALSEAGEIDIVIQNAGSGIFGSVEEVSVAAAREQWVTLVESPLLLFKLAAAHLRPRRTGWIIGISSLAGEMPMPFFAHYSAGKAALSSLLSTLWMELKPFGVQVVDLRPGDIRTKFNDAVPRLDISNSPYRPWADRAWQESCRLLESAPDPKLIADAIVQLLQQTKPPAMKRCGSFFQADIGALGSRLLSRTAILKSIRSYYGLNQLDDRND